MTSVNLLMKHSELSKYRGQSNVYLFFRLLNLLDYPILLFFLCVSDMRACYIYY